MKTDTLLNLVLGGTPIHVQMKWVQSEIDKIAEENAELKRKLAMTEDSLVTALEVGKDKSALIAESYMVLGDIINTYDLWGKIGNNKSLYNHLDNLVCGYIDHPDVLPMMLENSVKQPTPKVTDSTTSDINAVTNFKINQPVIITDLDDRVHGRVGNVVGYSRAGGATTTLLKVRVIGESDDLYFYQDDLKLI